MLNFMVTEEGLTDQMLNVVGKNEEPKKFDLYENTIKNEATSNKEKKEIEDKILNQIAGASGNLLEDDELILTLNESKKKYESIEESLNTAKNTMKSINAIRDHLRPVAIRVARYFFCLSDMGSIDPMYQYSLKWFTDIFRHALNTAEQGDKNTRNGFIITEFTEKLYYNVCQSLFEKDKLLFSLLMCLKVMDERKELDHVENRFLMTGGTHVEPKNPNPAPHWLLDKAWCTIEEMSERLPHFHGFDDHFKENIKTWENIYNSPQPHKLEEVEWPQKYAEDSIFHRIMILRIIRPGKVVPAIQDLI